MKNNKHLIPDNLSLEEYILDFYVQKIRGKKQYGSTKSGGNSLSNSGTILLMKEALWHMQNAEYSKLVAEQHDVDLQKLISINANEFKTIVEVFCGVSNIVIGCEHENKGFSVKLFGLTLREKLKVIRNASLSYMNKLKHLLIRSTPYMNSGNYQYKYKLSHVNGYMRIDASGKKMNPSEFRIAMERSLIDLNVPLPGSINTKKPEMEIEINSKKLKSLWIKNESV